MTTGILRASEIKKIFAKSAYFFKFLKILSKYAKFLWTIMARHLMKKILNRSNCDTSAEYAVV